MQSSIVLDNPTDALKKQCDEIKKQLDELEPNTLLNLLTNDATTSGVSLSIFVGTLTVLSGLTITPENATAIILLCASTFGASFISFLANELRLWRYNTRPSDQNEYPLIICVAAIATSVCAGLGGANTAGVVASAIGAGWLANQAEKMIGTRGTSSIMTVASAFTFFGAASSTLGIGAGYQKIAVTGATAVAGYLAYKLLPHSCFTRISDARQNKADDLKQRLADVKSELSKKMDNTR